MRSEQEVNQALKTYSNVVRKICIVHLKNYHDSEDVFQEVFIKYLLSDKLFESQDHERAWIIRVTVNACKDKIKTFFRKKVTSLEDLFIEPLAISHENRELLETILRLPEKYRIVLYLFYYEGYSAVEIAQILEKKENTIYTWLARGREQLKEKLGGDFFENANE